MRTTEMVISEGQRELILQVSPFLGEGIDFARQASGMLANRKVVSLHAVRVNRQADRRGFQEAVELVFRSKDQTRRHLDHPTPLARFDHHGVTQCGGWALTRSRQPPARTSAGGGVPLTVRVQQGVGIVRQIIAGEERDVLVEPVFQGMDELPGVTQCPLPNPPGRDQFMNRIERRPNPGIAIAPCQLFQHGQVLFLFVHKGPQLIQLTFAEMQMTKEIVQHALTVATDTGQPVTNRIFVALHQSSRRSNRDPFGQVAHALPINSFRRSNASVRRAHPTGKQMAALSTLQTAYPTMPSRPSEPRAIPRLTIPPTTPIPTVARRQVHNRNSLMRSPSGNCKWACDTNTRFPLPTSYRDTTQDCQSRSFRI